MSPAPSPVPLDEVLVSRRCKAKSSRTGNGCGRWASVGQVTCASHGARAPRARAAAARRVTTAKAIKSAMRSVELFGPADTADAWEILQREVARMSTFTAALQSFLTRLPLDAALAGEGRQVLDLYLSSQKQLVNVSRDTLALGLEARAQAMVNAVAGCLADVLRMLSTDASLTDDQRAVMQSTINREVRALGQTLTLELVAR